MAGVAAAGGGGAVTRGGAEGGGGGTARRDAPAAGASAAQGWQKWTTRDFLPWLLRFLRSSRAPGRLREIGKGESSV